MEKSIGEFMTLYEKAEKLTELLNKKNVIRIGVALAECGEHFPEDKLYVYLEKKIHKTKDIPTEFMGVTVITQVIGKIMPA